MTFKVVRNGGAVVCFGPNDAAYVPFLKEGDVLSIEEVSPGLAQEVPRVVSRFQARAALHLAGLLDDVEALMSAPETPALARLAWADAQEFKRNSPTMLAMAAELGLPETQLDDLFTVAAGIEA